MARIFITGSADGLGRMAAELLIEQGHGVVLHARSQARADETKRNVPEAEAVVIGDLGTIAQTRKVAEQVNAVGAFDAVIHNAAVGYKEPKRIETADGLSHVFAVNTIAPYILTALIAKPKRLVYLSSMLHQNGDPTLEDLTWKARAWDGEQAYSTRSYMTCSSPLVSHDVGLESSRMHWSQAGSGRRWVASRQRMIWTRHIAPRFGLLQAINQRHS
jgi:NAD(P)-dependent dehydrogenase (short-subunit alcohol dehydrogenase family)